MEGLRSLLETDLLLGLILQVVLAIVVMRAVWSATKSWKVQQINLAFLVVLVLMGLWHFQVAHRAVISWMLSFDNLIILGNLFCIWCGTMAGLSIHAAEKSAIKRILLPALLMTTGLVATVFPLYGAIPKSNPRTSSDGYCLQTNKVSCTPACSVTLLHVNGIEATEAEMIDRCICRNGTSWEGAYRGLRQKTHGTNTKVEVFEGSVEDLREMTPGHLLLRVGISLWQECDPIYLEQYGWARGKYHSVILTRFVDNEGQVEIIDPDVGLERWSLEDLKVLYQGLGIRLVER